MVRRVIGVWVPFAPCSASPTAIRACLFDLDGVLTDTAERARRRVEADVRRLPAAARASATGEPFVPFDVQADYDRVRRRQAPRGRRPRLPRLPRHHAARGDRRRPAGRRDGPRPRQPQERARPASRSGPSGVEVYRRLGALPAGRRASAGLRTARGVARAPTPSRCWRSPGSATSRRARRRGRRRASEHLRGQAGARHLPRRRRASLGVEPAAGGGLRGRAGRRGGRPGGRLRLRGRRRPRRPGRATARARRRRRRAGPGRTAGGAHDRATRCVSASSRGRCARPRSTSTCWPRASRCSRCPTATSACAATSTRASRTALPGTYLNCVLRAAPAAVRRGRLRLPRVRARRIINVTNGKLIRLLVDDEPFDLRYGDAALATSGCSTCAPACCAATSSGRSPGGRAVRVRSTPAGLAHPARHRRDRATRSRPVDAARAARRAVRAGRQRAAARSGRRSRGSRPRCDTPLQPRSTLPRRRGAVLVHRTQRSGLRWPPRWTTWSTGPTRHADRDRGQPTTRPRSPSPPAAAGRAAAAGQVRSPTAGRASGRCPPLRDQVGGRARRRRAAPAGTGCSPSSARYLDDFWARRRRRGRRRRRAAAGRPLRAVPRAAGRRAGRAPGDPGQGPDRPRLRRPHLLGHRDLRAAGAHLHRARRGRATRCAGGTRPWTLARERAAAARPGAARPSRGGRSAAQECSGYWPAGTAAFHVNADIADAVRPLRRRHRRRRVRARTSALELLVETARLWRSLGHHDRDGRFRIDGVTGPDEYSAIADNNVYTNLMAAAEPARGGRRRRPPSRRGPRELGVDAEEMAAWRDAADGDVHPVRRGARRAPAVRGLHRARGVGLRAHTGRTSTRCCCTTRTSTCTASRWSSRPTWCWRCSCCGDAFTAEQKARNFAYYEALTVRDSSLSACTQAVIAAEVGHLDLAYDYLGRGRADRPATTWSTTPRDGLHIASLAGAWIALVAGFGGMEFDSSGLSFAPRLPGAEQDQFRAGLAGAAAAGVHHRGRGGVPAGRRPADAPAPPRRAARVRRRPGCAPGTTAAVRRPRRAAPRTRPASSTPRGLSAGHRAGPESGRG